MSSNHKYKAICCAAVLFPLLNIMVSFFANNEGLMTIYFGSAAALIVYSLLICRKGTLSLEKGTILLCAALLIVNVWIWWIDPEWYPRSQALVFTFGMLIWHLSSKSDLPAYCLGWLEEKRLFVLAVRLIYYFFIAASVLRGEGVDILHWRTSTLAGPYRTSHILGYEMLLWATIDVIYVIGSRKKSFLFLLLLDSGLLFLTAARVTLLPLAVLYWAVIHGFKLEKKMLAVVAIACLGALALRYTSIFKAIIEKTLRAIRTSSITSGRGLIFKTSLEAYLAASPLKKILGMGIGNLSEYNRTHIWMEIHAHNDFIDALVQYGIPGFLIYVSSFSRLFRQNRAFFSLLMIGSLALMNGFYMYSSAVMGTVLFLTVDESLAGRKKRGG